MRAASFALLLFACGAAPGEPAPIIVKASCPAPPPPPPASAPDPKQEALARLSAELSRIDGELDAIDSAIAQGSLDRMSFVDALAYVANRVHLTDAALDARGTPPLEETVLLQRLRARWDAQRRHMEQLATEYGPQHPTMKLKTEHLRDLEREYLAQRDVELALARTWNTELTDNLRRQVRANPQIKEDRAPAGMLRARAKALASLGPRITGDGRVPSDAPIAMLVLGTALRDLRLEQLELDREVGPKHPGRAAVAAKLVELQRQLVETLGVEVKSPAAAVDVDGAMRARRAELALRAQVIRGELLDWLR